MKKTLSKYLAVALSLAILVIFAPLVTPILTLAQSTELTPTTKYVLWESVPGESQMPDVRYFLDDTGTTVTYNENFSGRPAWLVNATRDADTWSMVDLYPAPLYQTGNRMAWVNLASGFLVDLEIDLIRVNSWQQTRLRTALWNDNVASTAIADSVLKRHEYISFRSISEATEWTTRYSSAGAVVGNPAPQSFPLNLHGWDGARLSVFPSENVGHSTTTSSYYIGGARAVTDSGVVIDHTQNSPLRFTTNRLLRSEGVTFALPGDIVTVSAEGNYDITALNIINGENPVSYTDNQDGTYTFTMPEGIVDVLADYEFIPTVKYVLWESVPGESQIPDVRYFLGSTGTTVTYKENLSGRPAWYVNSTRNASTWSMVDLYSTSLYQTAEKMAWLELTSGVPVDLELDLIRQNSWANTRLRTALWNADVESTNIANSILTEYKWIFYDALSIAIDWTTRYTSAGTVANNPAVQTFPLNLSGWDGVRLSVFSSETVAHSASTPQFNIGGARAVTDRGVVIDHTQNGVLRLSTTRYIDAEEVAFAQPGETVTVSAVGDTPITSLKIISGANTVSYTDNQDGTFTFIMPDGIVDVLEGQGEPNEPELGDVDGIPGVDVLDLIAFRNHFINKLQFSTAQTALADMNEDGFVDLCDLLLLKEKLTNLPVVV